MLTQQAKLKLTLAIAATSAALTGTVLAASSPVDTQANPTATATTAAVGSPRVQQQIASQRFHDAKRCLESGVEMEQLSNRVKLCKSQPAGTTEAQACAIATQQFDAKVQANGGRAAQASCSADPRVVETQYREAVTKAATAGDVDAQLCYVQGWFPLASPADVPAYKASASTYMKNAYARGDWRVAQLLITASETAGHGGAGLMVNFPIVGTPFTVYREYRLLAHGATGAYATSVNAAAKDASTKLTAAQIANADTWAGQEYRRHFSKSPPLSAAPTPCFIASSAAEQ